jgi:hypothetical protein
MEDGWDAVSLVLGVRSKARMPFGQGVARLVLTRRLRRRRTDVRARSFGSSSQKKMLFDLGLLGSRDPAQFF